MVSQAADEAGGRAFATDSAGPLDALLVSGLRPFGPAELDAFTAVGSLREYVDTIDFQRQRDPDVQRVLMAQLVPPEGVTRQQLLGCPYCYEQALDQPLDGPALAAAIRDEVQPAREHLAGLFERLPYLTRLYTTMSADEMNEDPIFSLNPDLEDVSPTRSARKVIPCEGDQPLEDRFVIELADGRRLRAGQVAQQVIRRREGRTVQGGNGAFRIEQLAEQGPAELIEQAPDDPPLGDGGAGAGGGGSGATAGDEGGCSCQLTAQPAPTWSLLLGLALLALGRRRRHPDRRACRQTWPDAGQTRP